MTSYMQKDIHMITLLIIAPSQKQVKYAIFVWQNNVLKRNEQDLYVSESIVFKN